ncbi:MAG: response regulator [Pyrinomonadaceae bacterium]
MSTTFNQITRPAPILRAGLPTRPATVLLAEDDRALRRYLEVTLQRAGYHVITAADGLEAMKALLTSEVDALVTDAVMPHLGGHELCRFLRSHPKLSALPVVLLSGSNQPAPSPQDSDARADVYLSKPVRTEELANCVAQILCNVAA